MKTMIKFLILSMLFLCMMMQLKAQQYQTTGVVTLGSGILQGDTYTSVVILGDPSASDDMLEGENISGGAGFIFVDEEPLHITSTYLNSKFSVFPNPVDQYLTIQFMDGVTEDCELRIYSMDGKQHILRNWQGKDFDSTMKVNVSELENSVYILTITSTNWPTQQFTFLKR